ADVRRRWFEEADVEALVSEALAEPDAYRKLALCARWVRRQLEVGQAIASVIEEATRADPQAAELMAGLRRKPEARIEQLVDGLAPQLAADVTPGDAVAV